MDVAQAAKVAVCAGAGMAAAPFLAGPALGLLGFSAAGPVAGQSPILSNISLSRTQKRRIMLQVASPLGFKRGWGTLRRDLCLRGHRRLPWAVRCPLSDMLEQAQLLGRLELSGHGWGLFEDRRGQALGKVVGPSTIRQCGISRCVARMLHGMSLLLLNRSGSWRWVEPGCPVLLPYRPTRWSVLGGGQPCLLLAAA